MTPTLPTKYNTIYQIYRWSRYIPFKFSTISEKVNKYHPLIQTLKMKGWKVNPIFTLTVVIGGNIHKPLLQTL